MKKGLVKKLLISLVLIIVSLTIAILVPPPSASAQSLTISHPENLGDFAGPDFLSKVLSKLLPYAFIFAGLFFFLNLILSGFKLLMSVGNPEGLQEAKGCLLTSIGGLLLVLGSYWIAQIVEIIFKINIVN